MITNKHLITDCVMLARSYSHIGILMHRLGAEREAEIARCNRDYYMLQARVNRRNTQ